MLDLGVVERYEQKGIRVWRTDLLGGIDVTRSGNDLDLRSARAERGYPTPSNDPTRPFLPGPR